tara:strand:- start:6633 stop:7118 length:486 start_codon:yes stop_codon:yes gene_type:complete
MELEIPGINITSNITSYNNYDIIDQVFILFIIVNGSFINKTINKDLRSLIKSNIKYPYLILFSTIFFVTKIMKEKEYHPYETFIQSIKIIIFYSIIMGLKLKYLIITLLILLIIFLLDHYKKYHKKEINKFKNINKIEYILYIILIIIIFINYSYLVSKVF